MDNGQGSNNSSAASRTSVNMDRKGKGKVTCNLVPAQEERQYVRFFLRFCVLLLGPPSVIFEVRIKALNAAINQLPTAVAVVIVSARSESKQLSCVSLICCSDLDTKKKINRTNGKFHLSNSSAATPG